MSESKQSIQGVVFATSSEARAHGKGGIWYHWIDGGERRFPQDVKSVFIVMPVDWEDPEIADQRGIPAEWTVSHKNQGGHQWSLSGTQDRPTLHPSLHWVGMWHGYLESGYLRSCS